MAVKEYVSTQGKPLFTLIEGTLCGQLVPPISEIQALCFEFRAWDILSDEALVDFERGLVDSFQGEEEE